MIALNVGEGLSVLFMSQCVEKALDWCLRDKGSSLTWPCFK